MFKCLIQNVNMFQMFTKIQTMNKADSLVMLINS